MSLPPHHYYIQYIHKINSKEILYSVYVCKREQHKQNIKSAFVYIKN